MASWIGTRVFYAIIFFMLGAWAASSPGVKGAMRQAGEISSHSFEKMRGWTSGALTPPALTPGKSTEAAQEAAAPALAPAAAPAAAAPAAPAAPDLLMNARAAYAHHDVLGAINSYRDYIDGNPGDVGARGELGNVYFASGRLRDAARIFYEAAIMKLNGGDAEGARTLEGAVRQGDVALADDLERRIAGGAPEKK